MGYLQPSTMAEPATVTRTALGGPAGGSAVVVFS